jgi:manganese/zinc/iron transport system permease protein
MLAAPPHATNWTAAMLEALSSSIPAQIIATGALVGVAAATLGLFLVLRGAAMLTHAISHSIVLGIVLAWLLTGQTSGPLLLIGAALGGLLSVVLTDMLAHTGLVKMDAAIGLVFPALFAAGVLLIGIYGRQVHIDEHAVLLGEIGFVWLDTIPVADLQLPRALVAVAVLAAINGAFVALFWKELKLATFDPALARALGFAPGALGLVLLALTSATAVASFDAVGAVLFIAFVIVPPAAALLLTDLLGRALVLALAIAVASAGLGYPLAVWWDASIGGAMALMTGVFLIAAGITGPRYGLVAALLRRRGQLWDADCRSLAAHLFNHETGPEAVEENTLPALTAHLGWSDAQAHRVVLHSLDRGLVDRQGDRLRLTPKGRAVAQEIFEPWRRTATVPSN